MSGGYFDYKQFNIEDIEDEMNEIKKNIDKVDEFGYSIGDTVGDKEKFLETIETALVHLRLARIYTQRIDWLISGDDGPETFYERLKEDLKR